MFFVDCRLTLTFLKVPKMLIDKDTILLSEMKYEEESTILDKCFVIYRKLSLELCVKFSSYN
ncbi:hypothetical protein BpHYR1_032644 [Brachionus plicatilis]|uniref:Uncharacterized protein n=1 Tax=Brachionus plicatilis TaxID=10195 RepID=A0A3M7Q234_BRAPC|nr:hypothetical protein BpHYR1_032644 [Brachionus plicatilis]